jgi:hypothetical protein
MHVTSIIQWLVKTKVMENLSFEAVTAASQGKASMQLTFKQDLHHVYNLSGAPDWLLFDMATGTLLPSSIVIASHIFQHRWEKYLPSFSNFAHINDTRNGLLLYKPVEWAFDRAKLCVEIRSGRLMFRLLDQSLKDVKLTDMAIKLRQPRQAALQQAEAAIQLTYGDLDERELVFPSSSEMRPSKRLLLLHAHASWYRACVDTPGLDLNVRPPFDDISLDDVSEDEVTNFVLRDFVNEWKATLIDTNSPDE